MLFDMALFLMQQARAAVATQATTMSCTARLAARAQIHYASTG